jgi:hypothetical protein
MTGPAPALGPGLAYPDFLAACASLSGPGNLHGAFRPGPLDPSFESAEAHAVLEAMRDVFLPGGQGIPADPGAYLAFAAAHEDLLRSPAARQALAGFADPPGFGKPSPETEEAERRNLAGFPENTPERINRMLEKKRALERKALAAFCLKHGEADRGFAAMEPAVRREYLWMWAQSAFLARRRFARAAEAWARAQWLPARP